MMNFLKKLVQSEISKQYYQKRFDSELFYNKKKNLKKSYEGRINTNFYNRISKNMILNVFVLYLFLK